MITQIIHSTAAAMAAVGQTVSAVRLAVPLAPGAIPVLALVPKGAACGAAAPGPAGISLSACERPDDWRIALAPAPADALDAAFLAAAWELGAWDVARTERLPLPAGADPANAAHGIAHLIADPYDIRVAGRSHGEPMPCPVDGPAWSRAAATHGWLVWLAKPMRYGPTIRHGWTAQDRTLRPDGGRDPRPEPWRAWRPVVRGADHQTLLRLGRAPHGNRGRRRDP